MDIKFNKGEWSELYALLEILSTGKLYAADENLEKISTVYYKVLSALKDDKEYKIKDSNIIFESDSNEYSISTKKVSYYSDLLLNEIKNGKGSSFGVSKMIMFLDELKIKTLKQRSSSKGDVILKIHDDFTGFEPILSFSIKSYIGSKPTLLNASNGTVINYKLSHRITDEQIIYCNSIEGSGKIVKRIKYLESIGADLIYGDIPSNVFKENLEMIDSRLPELISKIYLESYFVTGKSMKTVVESFLVKNANEKARIIEYKIKMLLVSIALGMVPLTVWTGLDEATGGYIVVKSDGEVLCYHIYDRNKLKEYLYKSTKFDTPSLSRTNAGKVVTNQITNEQEFKLTMQIRF